MEIQLTTCRLAVWQEEYAAETARQANNPKVKRYLRDAFPHPYTLDHAREFIAKAIEGTDGIYRCILVAGKPAGSISVRPRFDVERYSGEMGYWLGQEYWGRSIASEAVRAMTEMAVMYHGLHRVFALVEAGNLASARVCEKAGYVFEARLREMVYKNGKFDDQLIYAHVAPPNPV